MLLVALVLCGIKQLQRLMNPDLLALKAKFTFLSDVSAAILQQKQRDFIEFKQQYFNKNRKTKVQRPQFKKKGKRDSFRLPNQKFKIVGNKIQLEKIGQIDFVEDRPIPENSRFLSVTLSKNSAGQYFASVLVETVVEALPKTGKTVGCDVGLKSFLVTSDKETFENPRYFRKSQAKIQQAQKHLSRKQKGLTLKERTYDCEYCGTSLDRDYNAAINLNRKAVGVHTA